MKIAVFLIHQIRSRFTCTESRYSKATTTQSYAIPPKNILQFAMDKKQIHETKAEIARCKDKESSLTKEHKEYSETCEKLKSQIENVKANLMSLSREKNYKKVLESRLEAKANELKLLIAEKTKKETKRVTIRETKTKLGKEMLNCATEFTNVSGTLLTWKATVAIVYDGEKYYRAEIIEFRFSSSLPGPA